MTHYPVVTTKHKYSINLNFGGNQAENDHLNIHTKELKSIRYGNPKQFLSK